MKTKKQRAKRFQPPVRETLTSQITEQIRQAIVTGELAPHESIAEGELAQQLGVSRAPVREMLMTLEREGLIETSASGRRRVSKLTAADFEELLDMRVAIESRSAFLLASRIDAETVKRLQKCIEQQAKCVVLLELSLLDIEFHTIIAEAAGNRRLFEAWMRIKPQLELWITQLHVKHENATQATFRITIESHQEMLETLQSGNPDAAEKLMRRHVQGLRTTGADAFQINQTEKVSE